MAGKDKTKKSVREDTVANLVNQLGRTLRNDLARELKQLDLYPGQDTVINLIAKGKTTTPGEIARALCVRPPTITKTIARLEQQGFVTRTNAKDDKRQVYVQLTTAGENKLKGIRKATKRVEKRAFEGLKKKERKQLHKTLLRLTQSNCI